MRASVVLISLVLAAAAAGAAVGQQPPPGQAGPTRPKGYLTKETTPNAAIFLPGPPAEGTSGYENARMVFKTSRALKDTPRWKVAQDDNSLRTVSLLADFSCTMGSKLTPENAPTISRILSRIASDTGATASTAKDVFKNKRPYQIDPGETCIPQSDGLNSSPDYPSGHTAIGWATALVLSQLAPDRTHALLTRGRAIGESRVVCGVHSPLAVEAGRMTGSAVVAALNGSAEFRADMDLARVELATIRADKANAVEGRVCGAEHGALGKTPYPQ